MSEHRTGTTKSTAPVALVGFNGVIKSTNDAWDAYFAYRHESTLSEVLYRLVHPADRTAFLTEWERLDSTDSSVRCTVRAVGREDAEQAESWLLQTRHDRDDVIVSIVESDQATTPAAPFETDPSRAFGANDEFADAILGTLDSMGHGLAVAQDNDIVWVNDAFLEIFGYDADEIIGTNGLQLVEEHDRGRVASMRNRRRAGESVDRFYELDGVTKSGRSIRIEMAVELRQVGDGANVVLSCRDISERVRQRESEDRLRRMSSMSRLAAAVGREYNDLVMSYKLLTDTLHERLDGELGEAPEFSKLDGVTRRAITLTRRLITLERQPLSRPQHVDLNILVWEAIEAIEDHLDVQIERRLTPGVPTTIVDRDLVELVLQELLDNANHASNPNSRVLVETSFVTVTPEDPLHHTLREGRYAVVRVLDDGVGIPKENLDYVFEPFFTSRPTESSGLGLTTVHNVVSQLGGHVEVDSSPRSGTRVAVYLPIRDGVDDGRSNGAAKKVSPETIDVVLIDSSEMIRELLEIGLSRFGYRVRTFASGARALEELESGLPCDVLVAELVGGAPDAIDFIKEVRTSRIDLNIVLISGRTVSEYSNLPVDLPNLSFLHKPFGVERLDREIRTAVEQQSKLA